jgi:hypothetical protein
MLLIFRRPHSRRRRITFADVCAMLGRSVISGPAEVVDL